MFDKLNYIELSGEKYPIKCDLVVLERIQEKYGDLSGFENKLTGFTPNLDKKGQFIKNAEGLITGISGQPNIKALNDALIWMAEEGADIEGKGKEISRREVLRKVDITPKELSGILYEEFNRCFTRKNVATTQRETTETENK